MTAPTTAPAPSRARPRGRTEVVNALLDAATGLFAARGPSAVSLRDVAREANVNLGLIHRYIGGKQDLLGMVLERRPGMPALQPGPPRTPDELVSLILELIAADAAYTKVVMRATLDGFDVPQLPVAFPVVERAVTALRAQLPERDADLRVAFLAAAAIGWQAIGGLLLRVLDQEGASTADVAAALHPALAAFVTAEPR
ncbi:MAG: helix-turn-helix domain-containing protein [Acidimicrobiales bacterium]